MRYRSDKNDAFIVLNDDINSENAQDLDCRGSYKSIKDYLLFKRKCKYYLTDIYEKNYVAKKISSRNGG